MNAKQNAELVLEDAAGDLRIAIETAEPCDISARCKEDIGEHAEAVIALAQRELNRLEAERAEATRQREELRRLLTEAAPVVAEYLRTFSPNAAGLRPLRKLLEGIGHG